MATDNAMAQAFDAPYAPVLASANRVVRVLTGLRPYRPQGFVIRTETIWRKTVIHNYGHGGCGVTLSFGCAELAAREAALFKPREAAVIGAGVIGLTTALALAGAGIRVTIYADRLPPDTTSDIAAALWEPTTLFSPDRAGEPFLTQFRFAARRSHQVFRERAGDPRYGVRWIRRLTFKDAPPPARPDPPAFETGDLYPGFAADPALRFGFPYAERHYALMIDTGLFMPALVADAERAGVRIVRRRFDDPADIASLNESVIFNCAGLGARALFGDGALTPVRGQLLLLPAQPEIDYGYVYEAPEGLLYMFPRQDAIVLGGATDYGDSSLDLRAEDSARIIAGHAAIAERIRRQQEKR